MCQGGRWLRRSSVLEQTQCGQGTGTSLDTWLPGWNELSASLAWHDRAALLLPLACAVLKMPLFCSLASLLQ